MAFIWSAPEHWCTACLRSAVAPNGGARAAGPLPTLAEAALFAANAWHACATRACMRQAERAALDVRACKAS